MATEEDLEHIPITSRLMGHINNCVSKDTGLFIVIVISIFFAAMFSWFSILKYLTMNASGYDLGIHAQVLWDTIHGRLMFSNLLGTSLLTEHFTLFEFVPLPLYYLYPSPITLLIFQDLFISFSAVPLYKILQYSTRNSNFSEKWRVIISILVVLSFELSPFTESLVSFDYHNIAFLPFFYFAATYSIFAKRRYLYVFSLAFMVSLHSNFVYIAALLVVFGFFHVHFENRKSTGITAEQNRRKNVSHGLFKIILMVIIFYSYLLLAGFSKSLIAGSPTFYFSPPTGQTGGLSSSPLGIAVEAIKNPGFILSIVLSGINSKLYFFGLLLASVFFLPLFSPLALLPSLPFIFYSILTTYPSYYALGYQYTGLIIPMIYVATALSLNRGWRGLRKFLYRIRGQSHKNAPTIALILILIMGMVIAFPADPIAPHPVYYRAGGSAMSNFWDLKMTNATGFLLEARDSIPHNSYILTQNNIMPFFSNFENAYSTPGSPGINENLSKIQFIVAELPNFWATQSGTSLSILDLVNNALISDSWGIYAEYAPAGLMILKRGFTGTPLFYVPAKEYFASADFTTSTSAIHNSGALIFNNSDNVSWTGPGSFLLPGNYNVTFYLNSTANYSGNFVNLNIVNGTDHHILKTLDIYGNNTALVNGQDKIVISLSVSKYLDNVNYQAVKGKWSGTLYFKGVEVTQTAS